MLKKILFLGVALIAVTGGFAQVKYQGHLGAGYGVAVGKYNVDQISVETVHGVRVNPYFFAGVGVGINYRTASETFDTHYYANARGYLLNKPISPYLSMDMGYGMYKDGGGFYTSPMVGVSFRVGEHYALALSAGLQAQQITIGAASWFNKHICFRFELAF